MKSLDPRLVRRAQPVRVLLGADVVIGVATTALVLAQASLLAWIVAHAFHGGSLDDVAPELVALLCVFAARAAARVGIRGRRTRGRLRPCSRIFG